MNERCDCPGNTFSDREARNDLKRLREKGPDGTTRALIDAIVARGIDGGTVLDIGGGVGAIQLGLLEAGAASVHGVDASEAYVATARAEAVRRGYGDRVQSYVGDFVALASDLPAADVVTLDRVLCCYSNMAALLGSVASHANRMIGLVYPRTVWWNRVAARVMNAVGWVIRDSTRWYLYPASDVDAFLRASGFRARQVSRSFIWDVVLYERGPLTASARPDLGVSNGGRE